MDYHSLQGKSSFMLSKLELHAVTNNNWMSDPFINKILQLPALILQEEAIMYSQS